MSHYAPPYPTRVKKTFCKMFPFCFTVKHLGIVLVVSLLWENSFLYCFVGLVFSMAIDRAASAMRRDENLASRGRCPSPE
ncbi:hypothetical protein GDO81_028760 [Engystomops pustulosus]|uniref:Uncharacterized protein n=1 Tax=Engystomops pustulosus TaxID=76066 RepID=A0AAV6YIB6_ENGPU|nr:hypothetical protein GDO81_028760 [Engystomops pustulosus]